MSDALNLDSRSMAHPTAPMQAQNAPPVNACSLLAIAALGPTRGEARLTRDEQRQWLARVKREYEAGGLTATARIVLMELATVRAAWRSLRASNRYVLKLPPGTVQPGPHGPGRRRTSGKSCGRGIQPTEPEAWEGCAGAVTALLAGTVQRLTAPHAAGTRGLASISGRQGVPDSALTAAWTRLGAAIAAATSG
jgi:hypothetical protein